MYRKISIFTVLVFMTAFFLTGCYDSMEIDHKVYPILIGIDGGVNNKLFITFQYPGYGRGVQNAGPSQENSRGNVSSVEAPSIIEACDLLNTEVSREVTLQHVKAFIFSEDIAEQGIGEYIASIQRYREIRSTVSIIVTRGKAEDFIKVNRSSIGPSISKMMELILSQSRNTSYFPEERFFEFYKNSISTYEQPIAAYAGVNDFHQVQDGGHGKSDSSIVPAKGFKAGDVPIKNTNGRQIAGTAVFDGDKMVGYLDTYETRYYLMVVGKFKSGIITIDDPQKKNHPMVTYVVMNKKPVVKAEFEKGKPVINVNLEIEADIESIHSRINYEKLNVIGDLNNYISQFILDGICNTIKKTQIKYNTDIFGFGHAVSKNFKTIQEWEKYNWLGHYKEAKINVNLDFKIRKMGTKIGSKEIWDSKGRSTK